ncbi:MAG: CHASE domain-containing protein [Rhodocyclaceae bacterium]|nr:CHASE domain-containing protein [Rhodocyclaceae bacterium]
MTMAGEESHVVLLLMPTYKGGQVPLDSEERRRAAAGIVFVVINLDSLFQGMSQWIETKGSFSVIDAPIMEDPEMLLYQSDIVAKGSHTHSAEVIAGGRVWQIQFKELAGQAEVPDRGRSQLTFAVGALATLLLTIAIAYQVALRERTERQLQDSQRSEDAIRAVNEELEARVSARTAQAEQGRKAAEVANATKSGFLAMISHEVRTPLGGVIGMLRFGLKDPGLAAGTRSKLHVGLSNAEILLQIINDILDYSKLEAGKMSLEVIDFDLPALIEDAKSILEDRAESKSLSLVAEIAPDLPVWCRADPTRLRQVLINLVSNAIKFTETGEVRLCVRRQIDPMGERLLFDVLTVASASVPRPSPACSRSSSRPAPTRRASSVAPVWGWPSASASSRAWAARSASAANRAWVRPSVSGYRWNSAPPRDRSRRYTSRTYPPAEYPLRRGRRHQPDHHPRTDRGHGSHDRDRRRRPSGRRGAGATRLRHGAHGQPHAAHERHRGPAHHPGWRAGGA